MNAKIDPAGLRTQLGEAERPEARVDRLVLAGPAADTDHLGEERLGPLLDDRPLLVFPGIKLGVELDVFHPHLAHSERRRHADDIDGDPELAAVLCRLIGELLVVPHLVGEGDDHDILLRCRGAVDPRAVGGGPDRGEGHLDAGIVNRHRIDRPDHLGHVVGRLFGDQRDVLAERDDEVLEIGTVPLRAVGPELLEHPLQPAGDLLPLGREADRLVEHPHDDRRPLPERRVDLGSQPVNGPGCATRRRPDRPPDDNPLVDLGGGGKRIERVDLNVSDELRAGLHGRHRNRVEDRGERLGDIGRLILAGGTGLLRHVADDHLLRRQIDLLVLLQRRLDDGHGRTGWRRRGDADQRQREKEHHMEHEAGRECRKVA